MFGSLLFLASAISLPQIANPFQITGVYPAWALRAQRSAATLAEIVVSADGKARSCKVVSVVGDAKLALEDCNLLLRTKYRPAKGPDGRKLQARYREFIIRPISGPQAQMVKNAIRPADMVLSVNHLWNGLKTAEASLALLVDAQGSATACDAAEELEDERVRSLIAVACREAVKQAFGTLTDEGGVAADYVTGLTVRFEASA